MRLNNVLKFLVIAGSACSAFAAPNFSIMGFASTDGGTTGGKGGTVVTPISLSELKKYAEDKTTPYIIRITKEFNTGVAVSIGSDGAIGSGKSTTYGDIIKLGSNKTLIGIGNAAFFNRIGLLIQCQSNIIIRNIKFSMKDVPIARTDENKVLGWVNGAAKTLSDPDCIGIQADDTSKAQAQRFSKYIWIDHCEFYNESPASMSDVDRYDGLVDGKNNSTNITISWCYFHDHHKASLMGKGNSDDFDRRITYSHNYFKNIASRLPLIRFGKVHLLNNYMVQSENGANARINSDLYIEGNHFETSKKPVFGKVSENGAGTFVNNKWVSCDRVSKRVLSEAPGASALSESEEVLNGSFKPSAFYSYTADPVANVASIVTANAGVGKINTDEYTNAISMVTANLPKAVIYKVMKNKLIIYTEIDSRVNVSNFLGKTVFNGKASNSTFTIDLPENRGIYLVKIDNKTSVISK